MTLKFAEPLLPPGVAINYDIRYDGDLAPDDEKSIAAAIAFVNKLGTLESNPLLELVATYAQQYAGLGTDGEVKAWARIHSMIFDLLTPQNKAAYLSAFPNSPMALAARESK